MITVIDRKSVIQAHAVALFAELILANKERVDRVEMDFAANHEFVFEARCYIPEPLYSEYGRHIASRASFMEITGNSETCIEDFDDEVGDCTPTERQYT